MEGKETPTEFLRSRNIVTEYKTELIISFDNGTEESLTKLLEDYGIAKYKQGFTDACNDIAGRIKTVAEQDPLV